MPGMSQEEIRTAGLLFGEELALGLVEPDALKVPEVQKAVRAGAIPSPLSRRFQVRQMAKGRLTFEEHALAPRMAARRAVLGDAALGRPRLLLRVDGFPHARAYAGADPSVGTARAAAFHAVLRDAGVPYLMAVLPRVPDDPDEPQGAGSRVHSSDERELLAELRRDGVAFGMHGVEHRRASLRGAPTEFPGTVKTKALETRLDEGLAALRDEALHTDVFVPPYDTFGSTCWTTLASRFDVVCGGAASVATMGFHATPSWRGDAVWLPAYPPLSGTATEVLPAVAALAVRQVGMWIPLALRWDEAVEDPALPELCALLAGEGLARTWDDFLLAVRASRQLAATF